MRILDWKSLSPAQRREALRRPAQAQAGAIREAAQAIIDSVRRDGDAALLALTEKFDGVRPAPLEVTPQELRPPSGSSIRRRRPPSTRPYPRWRRFHEAQAPPPAAHRDRAGSGMRTHQRAHPRRRPVCARRFRSPALHRHHAGGARGHRRLPGAHHVHAAEPRRRRRRRDSGRGAPIRRRSRVQAGGAPGHRRHGLRHRQHPQVRQVVRARHAFVTAAKLLAAQDAAGAAADLPAGPTEVMVIADEGARADFIAADLLAQAEHSPTHSRCWSPPRRRWPRRSRARCAVRRPFYRVRTYWRSPSNTCGC